MQLFKVPKIDFISRRRLAYVVSAGFLFFGMISLVLRGGLNYGIDFKGGTSIVLRFEDDISIPQIREALSSIDIGTSEIKSFGIKEYLIYLEQQRGVSATEMARMVEDAITESLEGVQYDVRKVDTVGPKIGAELRRAGILSVLIALLLILIYIGWRFELVFAVGAIVALFHAVLITLGIFNLMNIELSV